MKNISVIGAGYVGLVTAACFAELGNKVSIIEIEAKRVIALENGRMPINEPGLSDLWKRNQARGRITVTHNYEQGLKDDDFAFIAVGTPSARSGKPDLKWVRAATRSIAEAASGPLVVVLKSTVPVGTADMVREILSQHSRNGHNFTVISNPEFLREGLAVYDFMNPTRIVVGGADQNTIDSVVGLYEKINAPLITCDNRTAEMAKYASNTFLATRISFINEIALLCDECGADIKKVAEITGLEPRCGTGYMSAGLGWGGSCLPKDVRGLIFMAENYRVPFPLVRAVQRINQRQPRLAVEKLRRLVGSLQNKSIGILGLSFKPGSDDMREARSILVISLLLENGCRVKAYDPVAMEEAAKIMPEVLYCEEPYKVASGSDALILVTEWEEFTRLNFRKLASLMNQAIMVDTRNLYEPEEMVQAGFIYEGIGRRGATKKEFQALLLT
jgi:UDPglucose 6-dehydrogenase